MTQIFQTNFAAGEIAPSVQGREDIAKYASGARRIHNMLVDFHGGVFNRSGFGFVKQVKAAADGPSGSGARVRLIPFQFNTLQTYILEFGDRYMRVFKDGGIVLEPAIAVTGAGNGDPLLVSAAGHGYSDGDEVFVADLIGMDELNSRFFTIANVTLNSFELVGADGTLLGIYGGGGTVSRVFVMALPYRADELALLKFVQSADTMFFVHQDHPPATLTRTDHHVWQYAESRFAPSIDFPTGVTAAKALAGTDTFRYRVTAVKGETLEESLPGLEIPSTIATVTNTDPVRVTSAGPLLVREGEEVHIENVTGMTQINGRRFRAANVNVASNIFDLEGEDGTGYPAGIGGDLARSFAAEIDATLESANPITLNWNPPTGLLPGEAVDHYVVYREDNGIFGLIGTTEKTSYTDANILTVLGDTPPKARNPFRAQGKFPGAVGLHEQRAVYGNSFDEPQKTFMSQSADFRNFSVSQPTKDDDAVTFSIFSRAVNEVRHYVSLGELLILTSGGVWRISGDKGVITPASIDRKPQTFEGASHIPPILTGNVVLYVEEGTDTVRDLGFDLQSNGFTGNDLTQLAPHIFERAGIVDWAYAKNPSRIVWVVLDNGNLATLTFVREQNVFAWATASTDGAVESIATIREGREDIVYAVIKRRINGTERRYIERLRERRFAAVEDAFIVDSGLSYNNPIDIATVTGTPGVVTVETKIPHGMIDGDPVDLDAIRSGRVGPGETDPTPLLNGKRFVVGDAALTSFTLRDRNGGASIDGAGLVPVLPGGVVRLPVDTLHGFGHLEGETVAILADGKVMPPQTVTDGKITVGTLASRIHAGLAYTAELETLPPSMEGAWGLPKSVNTVWLRLEANRGLFVGRRGDDPNATLSPVERRSTEPWDRPVEMVTGLRKVNINSGWDADEGVVIRQTDPVPAKILGAIARVDVGR